MSDARRTRTPAVTGAILIFLGLLLVGGGGWLIALGGSWYYLLAGIVLAVSGWLLIRRNPVSLWVYAALLLGTLLWSLWEAGLDWWPIAARGDVFVLIGLFLLTPWITRPLSTAVPADHGRVRPVSPFRGAGLPLTVTLVAFFAVAVASWFHDPHKIEGELPPSRVSAGAAQTAAAAGTDAGTPGAMQPASGTSPTAAVPDDEWHAYGRTGFGQRYSPLAQITPDNAADLEPAWTYNTGDMRGRPGDPEETTFQVAPLKIGQLLYLCTPHQLVIALNATTGKEVWRYDPEIQGELALQHLTCRGLSYHPGSPATTAGTADAPSPDTAQDPGQDAAAPVAGAKDAASQPASPDDTTLARMTAVIPGQPMAARDKHKTRDDCTAKLFMPTADARIIALDPETGAVCTNFGAGTGQINLWANMPFVNPGSYYSTSPVVVTANRIVVGGTVLDNVSTTEPSGVIRGFDVDTGALVWNWDPDKPDSTEPIAPGELYTPNSPNSWSISSVDEALGMVYIPMGNQPPDQWGGKRSEETDRFASSVVALDLETGRLRWHFRTVHHDLWDYDVPSQPSLIDLTINGDTVPALVQPTKQGELFVLDRRTGEPLLPVTERPVPQGAVEGDFTAPTQPVSRLSFDPPPLSGADMWGATLFDQLACRIAFHRLRYEGRYTPPSLQGTLVYPGNFGVFNWGSIAVDPQRQVAFTTPAYLAFVSQLVPRADDTTLYVQGGERPHDSLPALNENFGAPYAVKLSAFTSALGLPCQAPPWGYVAGVDLTTGDVAWMHRNGTVRDSSPLPLPFRMGVPSLGGPLMTGGGVAFLSGTLDYYLRAYDVTNGKELWRGRLPAGGQATPVTYTGEDGRQYVVVAAGGHGSLGTKAGDAVMAFALPDAGKP